MKTDGNPEEAFGVAISDTVRRYVREKSVGEHYPDLADRKCALHLKRRAL